MDIQIVEVGPRDGLQNEKAVLPTDVKVEMIDKLVDAGCTRIEAVSFAHPERVPQMADAEAVMSEITKREAVSYIGLVMNERGLRRAQSTEVDEINFSISATDGFNLANLGVPVEETLSMIESEAPALDRPSTATVSVVWGCPFDGEVDPERVVELCRRLAQSGVQEIALADTIGVANPWAVADVLATAEAVVADVPLRVHFHDTRNTAGANVYAAIAAGIRVIDSSVGGLGGCPFAPRATGNVATNDLVYMLERGGHQTGLDLARLGEITRWIGQLLGAEPPSLVARAGGFPV